MAARTAAIAALSSRPQPYSIGTIRELHSYPEAIVPGIRDAILLARQNGFSPARIYAWRAKCGGMETEDVKRLKELESGNNRLKRLLAEAHMDIEVLKVGFGVNPWSCKQARGGPAHVRTHSDKRAELPPCGNVPRCLPP